jgi:Leucine-rich repeat (LRR) protein
MEGQALKGIGVLQHLQELVLISNPLRTVSYLTPLPPSLISLTLQRAERVDCSFGPFNRLDVSEALSKPAGLGDPGKPTASSGISATLGSSLLALHIPGMDLEKPSVLSTFTGLTALHARDLHSRKGRELLALLPCLRKLRYLDLSIKHEQSFCNSPYYKLDSQHNPCLVTADFERLV